MVKRVHRFTGSIWHKFSSSQGSRHVFIAILMILCLGDRVLAEAGDRPQSGAELSYATFAGGCFWCMEKPFDSLEGVHATISGYSGGDVESPTYAAVSSGSTGHAEVVQITYDPKKVTYEQLLDVFWHNIDPTVENRQFCDFGTQYRSAIFYHTPEQKRLAEESLARISQALKANGKSDKVFTKISAFKAFYPAEDYHQDYYLRNPVRYKYYRYRCGRDERLEEIWGAS